MIKQQAQSDKEFQEWSRIEDRSQFECEDIRGGLYVRGTFSPARTRGFCQISSNLSGSVDREADISQVDQEIQDNLQKYRELQPSANTDSSARMECTYLLMKLRELADSSDDRQLKIRIAYAINRKKTYGDFVPL